jgi:hypothetical protein
LVTKEQVARALNVICDRWLRRKGAAGPMAHVAHVIDYYQRRNAAAMRSRGKLTIEVAL